MGNLFTEEDLRAYTIKAYECPKAHGFRSPELRDEHDMWLIISELAEATQADRKGDHSDMEPFQRLLAYVGDDDDTFMRNLRFTSKIPMKTNFRTYAYGFSTSAGQGI